MTAFLRKRLAGRPRYVWMLWALGVLILAACPMMLSDPAMWLYLLDPELLALIVVIGLRYTMLQLSLMRVVLRHLSGAKLGVHLPGCLGKDVTGLHQ